MTGPRVDRRYQLVAGSGASGFRALCDVDEDSIGLVLNGVANLEAGALATSSTFNFYIPVPSGRNLTNIFARQIRVEFTGSLPEGRVNPVTWVVVFRLNVFAAYSIGQTGTFRGLPVVCTDKRDGQPTATGAFA